MASRDRDLVAEFLPRADSTDFGVGISLAPNVFQRRLSEVDSRLSRARDELEIRQILAEFETTVAEDPAIPNEVIQSYIIQREHVNRQAASNGPVPYPSPSTMASIFGISCHLSRALEKRRNLLP